MTAAVSTIGSAPRHLELARQAIRRHIEGFEPLERAIARAIEAALREAADVGDLTGDRRSRLMSRALAILRLRGSLSPADLDGVLGHRYRGQARCALKRLVVAGFARRAGWGRYVPAQLGPVGRPSKAALAVSACAADASASPAPAPRPRATAPARRRPAA